MFQDLSSLGYRDWDLETQQDLRRKLSALLIYDFEAAIRLKAWDGARAGIAVRTPLSDRTRSQDRQISQAYGDRKILATFASIVLSSYVPLNGESLDTKCICL